MRGWVVALVFLAALPALPSAAVRAQPFTAATVAELVAAIKAANGNGQANVITLAAGATYTLTVADNGLAGDETGLPRVTGTLTITGNGAVIERSSAQNTPTFRILAVNTNATLTISGLTVRNGSTVGTAGVAGNRVGNAVGGAILVTSGAALTVTNCTFMANRAVGGKGGDGVRGTGGAFAGPGGSGGDGGNGSGGAISNAGTLVIRGATFAGNSAVGSGGGNGGAGGNATSGLGGTGGNGGLSGVGSGGAIQNAGTLTVTNTTFTGDSAIGGNGANGGAGGVGTGGGIAGYGANGGDGLGGSLAHSGGTLTATNVTIARNSATGGALGTGQQGNAANGEGFGGGIRSTTGVGVTVKNTLLAANTASDGNCSNTVVDGGYNLDYDPATTCSFATHAQTNDPVLGSLVNHGGPTPTLDIALGGAATGMGNPTVCAGAPVGGMDQRGVSRAAGCSIGAYEPQVAPFPMLAAVSPASGGVAGGSSVTLTGTGFVGGATVTFGAVSATVTLVTSTRITATAPPHASGAVDIAITNPDLQGAALSPGYTFGIVAALPGARPPGGSGGVPSPLPPMRVPGPPSGNGPPNPLPPHR